MNILKILRESPVWVFANLRSSSASRQATAYEMLEEVYSGTAYGKQIEAARGHEKGSEQYQHTKEQIVPAVRWGFDDSEKGGEKQSANGLVYLDIDAENSEAVFNLPYVLAMWRSFGGKGYAALAYADGVTGANYAEYYYSISHDVFHKTNVILDEACANPDRLNVLSYDNELKLKDGDCVPFVLPKYSEHFSNPANNVFKKYNDDPSTDTELEQLLEGRGWHSIGKDNWARPGRDNKSMTWNRSGKYNGVIYVWTSESELIHRKAYDKAELLKALNNWDGKTLAAELYKRYPSQNAAPRFNAASPTVKRGEGYQPDGEPDDIDKLIELLEIEGAPEIVDMHENFGSFDIFPEALANPLHEYADNSGLKREFIMHAVLFNMSVATLGKLWVQVDEGHQESPIIWGITLGNAGSAKSPPHKAINRPLINIQRRLEDEYQTYLSEYESAQEMSKKEKERNDSVMVAPIRDKVISTDGTLEGLIKALYDNKGRGVGKFMDEIEIFLNGMDAYKSGGKTDAATWLKMFNRSEIVRDLVKDSLPIFDPYAPISGTGVIDRVMKILQKNGYTESGFYERFTYWLEAKKEITPEYFKRKSRFDKTRNTGAIDIALGKWEAFINRIYNWARPLQSNVILEYDNEAVVVVEQWEEWFAIQQAEMTKRGDEKRASMYSKIRIYFYRLPILMWLARNFAEDDGYGNELKQYVIIKEDIAAASHIANYLISTYNYVHEMLFDATDPVMLDKDGVAEFRKRTAIKLRKKEPKSTQKQIADAVNRLTKQFTATDRSTVGRWLKEAGL